MSWNNGREHAKFEREQARFRQQYIAAGMTEEQIQTMYDYDKAILNGNRREAEHSGNIDFEMYAETNGKEMDLSGLSRYAWIDEIENERLVKALKAMPQDYIEILTDIAVDGLSQADIARKRNVGRSAISNKIKRIKDIFGRF